MLSKISHLLITLTASTLLQAADAENVSGVNSYRNVLNVGSYNLHTEEVQYSEAEEVCAGEDAHLAVPTSKEAQEVMVDLLRNASLPYAFVGVTDTMEEGKFVTVKGQLYSEVGYTVWKWGNPDDDENDEDCMMILSDKLVNDISCNCALAFFCEKNRLFPHDPF